LDRGDRRKPQGRYAKTFFEARTDSVQPEKAPENFNKICAAAGDHIARRA